MYYCCLAGVCVVMKGVRLCVRTFIAVLAVFLHLFLVLSNVVHTTLWHVTVSRVVAVGWRWCSGCSGEGRVGVGVSRVAGDWAEAWCGAVEGGGEVSGTTCDAFRSNGTLACM